MEHKLYLVIEGELPHYYDAYCPHGIFSDDVTALLYADRLIKANESARWPNVTVLEFVINQLGYRDIYGNERRS